MAAITDLSDLVNRMTGGNSGTPENIFAFKAFTIAGTADSWNAGGLYSTWLYDGFPGPGSAPGAAAIPTSATAGAIPFTNPGGGRTKWLVQASAIAGDTSAVGGLLLYDRLLHISGLSGTTITAQNVQTSSPTPALTRYTGGTGNQIMVEIYTAIGTTARTITASYTNQAGTTGRTTPAFPIGGSSGGPTQDANACFILPLQAGDTGVRAVESVTISASTGTAGNFGVNIIHPLSWLLPNYSGGNAQRDFTVGPGGLPEIQTNACLATAVVALTGTEVPQWLMLSTVEA